MSRYNKSLQLSGLQYLYPPDMQQNHEVNAHIGRVLLGQHPIARTNFSLFRVTKDCYNKEIQ